MPFDMICRDVEHGIAMSIDSCLVLFGPLLLFLRRSGNVCHLNGLLIDPTPTRGLIPIVARRSAQNMKLEVPTDMSISELAVLLCFCNFNQVAKTRDKLKSLGAGSRGW